MEIAGSLGDIGTLLPLGLGMIIICGLSAQGVFLSVGLFYILAGLYYRLPTPVQPMKVVAATAIATAASPDLITAAGLLIAVMLLIIAKTGAMDWVQDFVPTSVIRGVQLTTGTMLAAQGAKLIGGTSLFQDAMQQAEPFLTQQTLAAIPVGWILAAVFAIVTLRQLSSRRVPAGIAVLIGGCVAGALLGGAKGLAGADVSLHLPELLPFGLPSGADFLIALTVMALPQLPMTLGNASVANADLSAQYFGDASTRVTPTALCWSMAAANLGSAFLGGMPMCHGAGGLAAHYRFGARTGGSNIIIGVLFTALAVLLGADSVAATHLLPLSVLGVLLIFAGTQLGLTILDMRTKNDMLVVLVILGVGLGTNLAWGCLAGLLLGKVTEKRWITL